jgi:hypothetical protein
MSVRLVLLEDGTETVQFRLEFSRKGIGLPGIAMPVSVQSAARMRHPPGCPHTASARKKPPARSKRRRRKRR